jgi:hypothetical protein
MQSSNEDGFEQDPSDVGYELPDKRKNPDKASVKLAGE